MSRSKRARAKMRRHAAERPEQRPTPALPSGEVAASRLAPARRRAQLAKIGVAAVALASAGVSMALARITYAGHAKHPVQDLAIPQPLYRVVRQNLLQAGIMAPATAPPDIATSSS